MAEFDFRGRRLYRNVLGENEHRVTVPITPRNQVVAPRTPRSINFAVTHLPTSDRVPHLVSVRVETIPENLLEDDIPIYAMNLLRSEVEMVIREYNRNIDPATVNGVFGVANNRYISRSGTLEELLTVAKVEELLDMVVQSNEYVTILDMELSFRIVRGSLDGGAGIREEDGGKIPSWLLKNCQGRSNYPTRAVELAWKNYSIVDGGLVRRVSCAAIAIGFFLEPKLKPAIKYREAFLRRAYYRQKKYGLGEYATVDQILSLVEHEEFWPWRITVIDFGNIGKNVRFATATGRAFDETQVVPYPEGGKAVKNCMYLYRNTRPDHYVGLLFPGTAIRKYNNLTWKFCQKCIVMHPGIGVSHECSTYKPPPKKCVYCGITHEKPGDCFYIQCRDCHGPYPRSEGKIYTHRCLILPKIPKTGIDTEQGDSGKKVRVWAYDIESCLESEEVPIKIPCYQLDLQHRFITEPVMVQRVTAHVPMWVGARDIYGDALEEFYGEGAFDDFVRWTTTVNKGNNIFVAHNGSGYDTNLVLESLYRNTRGFIINEPIRNGTKTLL